MATWTDYKIVGPDFATNFSPIDQVVPPIYSRRILIFSQPEDHDVVIAALQNGLQATVNEVPALAGQMGYAATGWTVKKGHALLRVRTLDLDFAELEASSFSETLLPAEKVSTVPTLADPQEEWNSCRIHANFLQGGLLLVISINHMIADGHAITLVTERLARYCREQLPSAAGPAVGLDRTITAKGPGDEDKLAAYTIVQGPTNLGSIPAKITTTTFRLSESALKHLKAAASPAEGWITTHDAVNALCWQTHARSRRTAQMLTDDEVARFAFPVEFRKLLSPPLSADFVGNAVLMTKVELPVRDLLRPDGLKHAAAAIRAGVREVDEEHVRNFVAVAQGLEKPGQLKINLKLTDPHTAFGSTSYKSFDHRALNWDPVLGKFERLRLASGVTGEGMSIILPVLADGSWEVTVTLEEAVEDFFRADELWKKYTS